VTLVVLALGWLGGITAVALWNAPGWFFGLCLLLLIPLTLRNWLPLSPLLLAGTAVVAVAGGLRFEHWEQSPPPLLAEHTGQHVGVTGVVRGLQQPGITTSRFRIDVNAVHTAEGTEPISGGVLVTLGEYAALEPGATVRVRGRLDEPPVLGDFDYRAYLARQGVVATMFYPRVTVEAAAPTWSRERMVGAIRQRLEDGVVRSLPEPAASVAAGISLGRPGTVPRELYDDYRSAGLAHILAVSGAHLSVLSGLVFFGLLQVVNRRTAIWPAMAVIVLYVFLAGAPFSVVRAAIMAVIFLLGVFLGKQQASLSALAAAAIVMTAFRPATALEAGFQLSLSATAGLIVFAPWIRHWIGVGVERVQLRGLVPPIVEHVAALSLAATITTAPILWVTFGHVPLIGPVSNIVVEPVFALAFGLSLVTAFAGTASETAGWAVGLGAYYPLSVLSWTATTLGNAPYASVELPRISANWALLAYVVLAVPGWFAYRHLAPIPERPPISRGERHTRRIAIGAAAGALAVGVAWHSLLPLRGPGELEVTMLDIGQGDAVLVVTPGGQRVLVDGGPSGTALAHELGPVLPHWARTIDAIVLSHPEADHVGGLPEALRRYRARDVYDNGAFHDTQMAALYYDAAPKRTRLEAGDSFELDGVAFEVLWPPGDADGLGPNDLSVVLRVEYGETVVLLTGDIEHAPQRAMVEEGVWLEATVLKVPHHGGATSSRAFLEAVGAPVALISAGEGNRYGHPAQVTMNQLDGASIYRTDIHGRVTVRSDGERVRVETQR
jgi:competence protein ComEC